MTSIKNNLDSALIEQRKEKNVKYLKHTLQILPSNVLSLDNSKVLLAYFAISGLDILSKLDKLPHSKQALIDWIYFHQITDTISKRTTSAICGCRGSTSLVTQENKSVQNHDYDCAHVTMTFSALNCLLTLGDDLSKINKTSLLKSLSMLQLPDGSVRATFQDFENDVRFLYSACSISYILNDWSALDKNAASQFLATCLTFEGAFGQNPEAEAHGGSTFCSVASLYLMNKLDILTSSQKEELKLWCLNRQTTGFNGRVNKPWDTCYSFWIGSTLKILNSLEYSNYNENINYIFETYNEITGGFAKWPDCSADPLHTFMGICGLSLVGYPTLETIHPALVISEKAFKHLQSLHAKWSAAASSEN
jgi:geranylgeranyl transferase type-1 subunit beta